MKPPEISYFVCGTPRSGSSLLCGYLANTEIAGKPEEYYWKDNEPFGYKEWGVTNYEEYLAKTIELGATPNGVFGAKVMWGYMNDFLAKLRALSENSPDDDKELLNKHFPNPKFVFIWREDAVAEAVSWAIAGQTGVWFHGDDRGTGKEPVYDFLMIDHLVEEVESHNRQWQKWFQDHEIAPLVVAYEELIADPNKIVGDVIDHIGIIRPDNLKVISRNKKQGGGVNEEWKGRYLKEKKEKTSL